MAPEYNPPAPKQAHREWHERQAQSRGDAKGNLTPEAPHVAEFRAAVARGEATLPPGQDGQPFAEMYLDEYRALADRWHEGRAAKADRTSVDYQSLRAVLDAAYYQAAHGKGKERHARGNPFHTQHMQTISKLLDSERGMAFQAIKKLTEGLDLADRDARERELLGAINYIAGIVVYWRLQDREV
jgi:hypothetical protein